MDLDCLIVSARAVTEAVLKRLILIFDHVVILDPHENHYLIPDGVAKAKGTSVEVTYSAYGAFYRGLAYEKRELDLLDRFDYAYKKGIVRVLNLKDRGFYHKWWFPLRIAYELDTASGPLLELTRPFLQTLAYPGNDRQVIRHTVYFLVQGGPAAPAISFPEVPSVFTEQDAKEYSLYQQAFSVIGKLDRALAACGEYGLVPAFVDRGLESLLMRKIELARENSESGVKAEFQRVHSIGLHNVQYFLYKVSEQILPDEALQKIDIKELVVARNNTFQELYKLRRKLLESVAFLQRHDFDEGFTSEVESYIERKLIRELKEYESRFSESFERLLKTTIRFATVAGPILAAGQLDPLELALLTGASAELGNIGSNLVEVVRRKRKTKNTFAYFMNFQEQN